MNNQKTEEIVAILRHCTEHNCIMCPAYNPPNSSTCFATLKAACDRLEELEAERVALKADLTALVKREIEDECELCKHCIPRVFCRSADYTCGNCSHIDECVCMNCGRNRNFEWRGVPLPELPKEE